MISILASKRPRNNPVLRVKSRVHLRAAHEAFPSRNAESLFRIGQGFRQHLHDSSAWSIVPDTMPEVFGQDLQDRPILNRMRRRIGNDRCPIGRHRSIPRIVTGRGAIGINACSQANGMINETPARLICLVIGTTDFAIRRHRISSLGRFAQGPAVEASRRSRKERKLKLSATAGASTNLNPLTFRYHPQALYHDLAAT